MSDGMVGPDSSGSHLVSKTPSEIVYALPAERVTVWNPGVPAGIPVVETIHARIMARSDGQSTYDVRKEIQAALDEAGEAALRGDQLRVVQLERGVYPVSGELYVPSRVILRGAGPDATQLVATGIEHPVVVIGHAVGPLSENQVADLLADGVKGSHQVVVSTTLGLAPGDLVLLDEETDEIRSLWNPRKHPPGAGRDWYCRENRPIAQMAEITAITGQVVSFSTPLHIDFRKEQRAQLVAIRGRPVRFAGLEDLRVTGGRDGNIRLSYAANCWVRHIESDDSYGSCVSLSQCFRCTVRDSYLHDSCYYNNGGAGYGFDLSRASADNLVENNISIRFNKVINCRSSGGGNVVAYNYMDDGAMNSVPEWVETGLQASHYPTPHFELFEGNYCFNLDADFTEGNAIFITYFRNQSSGLRRNTPRFLRDTRCRRMAGAMKGHYWYNFVGNVLGFAGMQPGPEDWTYEGSVPWRSDVPTVWMIGYWSEDWRSCDANVEATMIRDGNFDYVTSQVHWCHTLGFSGRLPDSLYLRSKPAFFGELPWPWVDPLGTEKVFSLPAKARFDAGRPNG